MSAATRGVIDIGSNAVRFVAYGGAARAPVPVYNEKLPVSLGRSVLASGSIGEIEMQQTLEGLTRFRTLAEMMGVERLRIVGTAAIRDAANGAKLVDLAGKQDVHIEVLDGDGEAIAAGLGVLSDVPQTNGYAADLGGGSLELVRISDGQLLDRISLPLGTSRLPMIDDLAKAIRKGVAADANFSVEKGLELHLIGGAWRAMAQLDQAMLGYPFRIVGNHRVGAERIPALARFASDKVRLKSSREVPSARVDALHDAVRLLAALVKLLEPREIATSSCGIREGLLFQELSVNESGKDPLIACTEHEARRLSRQAFDGHALERWTAGIFEDEHPQQQRLRHSACLLADVSWSAHPDHRALHAMEAGLFGNWTGVDIAGRLTIARALFMAHAGKGGEWPDFSAVNEPVDIRLADHWGLAIRLAMRLGGGTAASLNQSRLYRRGNKCVVAMPAMLDPAAIVRRHNNLAAALDLKPEIELL